MLAFEETQLAVLKRETRARFDALAIAWLSGLRLPWGDAEPGLVEGFVDRMVPLAAEAGLYRECDAIALMALVLRLGPERWLRPDLDWMRQKLRASANGPAPLPAIIARMRVMGLDDALDPTAMQTADSAIAVPGAYAATGPEALLAADEATAHAWGLAYLAAEAVGQGGFGRNAVGDPVQPIAAQASVDPV